MGYSLMRGLLVSAGFLLIGAGRYVSAHPLFVSASSLRGELVAAPLTVCREGTLRSQPLRSPPCISPLFDSRWMILWGSSSLLSPVDFSAASPPSARFEAGRFPQGLYRIRASGSNAHRMRSSGARSLHCLWYHRISSWFHFGTMG